MEENNNAMMSDNITEISAALIQFQSKFEQPALNKTNPYFKSRYIHLSGILKAIQPLLSECGLSVIQPIVGENVITILMHKSGQWIKGVCSLGSNCKTQQDRGSAITYTRRYSLCSMLSIAADTDDDGNAASESDRKAAIENDRKAAIENDRKKAAIENEVIRKIESCQSRNELNAVFIDFQKHNPEMCKEGTKVYKAAAKKGSDFPKIKQN